MICNIIAGDVYCTAVEGLPAILSMPLHLCSGAAVPVDKSLYCSFYACFKFQVPNPSGSKNPR